MLLFLQQHYFSERERLDFMVQGKINRGRHTDHPAGRHSISTNQRLPPRSLFVSPVRLSVVCLSVTLVHPTQALKFSAMFLRHLVP